MHPFPNHVRTVYMEPWEGGKYVDKGVEIENDMIEQAGIKNIVEIAIGSDARGLLHKQYLSYDIVPSNESKPNRFCRIPLVGDVPPREIHYRVQRNGEEIHYIRHIDGAIGPCG